MFTALPLLIIPILLYNLIAIAQIVAGNPDQAHAGLVAELFSVPMPSGGQWSVSGGDLLILLGLFMLFFELVKSTSSEKVAIVNHSLSMVLFIVALVEFLLLPGFATSTFFLLTMMVLLDVVAGFTVTIISARKDFEFGGG